MPSGDELVFDPVEVEFELCYQVAALPPHVVLARAAEGLAEASHAFGRELDGRLGAG